MCFWELVEVGSIFTRFGEANKDIDRGAENSLNEGLNVHDIAEMQAVEESQTISSQWSSDTNSDVWQ